MSHRHLISALVTLALLIPIQSTPARAEIVELHIPVMSDSPTQHLFYHELLTLSLKQIGHTPKLVIEELPQKRISSYLEKGDLSLFWMVESEERNQKFSPIEIGLTNGLIGKRLLLIRKEDQPLFDKVRNLDDFRKLGLVGGMGEGWFDVRVWEFNHLKHKEQSGNWQAIFKMMPLRRDYDYFARGLSEISAEATQYPDLAIEKRLALVYQRDLRFYLSKTGPHAGGKHMAILQAAIANAKRSGLMDQLIKKYWGDDFEKLGYERRLKIRLATPS